MASLFSLFSFFNMSSMGTVPVQTLDNYSCFSKYNIKRNRGTSLENIRIRTEVTYS